MAHRVLDLLWLLVITLVLFLLLVMLLILLLLKHHLLLLEILNCLLVRVCFQTGARGVTWKHSCDSKAFFIMVELEHFKHVLTVGQLMFKLF